MKKCSGCKQLISLDGFHKNAAAKDGVQSNCIPCHKVIRSKSYLKHKVKINVRVKAYMEKRKEFIRKLKSAPCTDCKRVYPYYVMDFDHLYDKSFDVSRKAATTNRELLLEELAKCELVCANCHRERSHSRYREKWGLTNHKNYETLLPTSK